MTLTTGFDIASTAIDGLLVITQKQVSDDRGVVREFYRQSTHGTVAELRPWRQINVTESVRGAVRGLHGEQMTKLIACISGDAFGAYLDAREASPTFGAVVTVELQPGTQVLVPAGVCNGFQAVSDVCQYLYCFDDEWRAGMAGVGYDPLDPGLAIAWPLPVDPENRAQLSAKDAAAPRFSGV